MKKAILLSLFLCFQSLVYAQGIIFEPNIEAAFQKAKANNKLIFVECYHPNCPVCMTLEPTLKNAEVGTFYNKNFVNFKLNLSDASQVKFLNSKNIYLPGFPMFLYFDKDKNLLFITDGEKSPESFISKAKTALNPKEQATNFKSRYEAGERSLDFLVSYGYYTRVVNDTTNNYKIVDDLYNIYPKEQLSSQMSWAITKKMVMNIDNGFAQYWFDHIDVAKSYEHEHPDGEKNVLGGIIQNTLYSKRGMSYPSVKVEKIKEYMTKIGAGQYAENVTWPFETQALFRENQSEKAMTIIRNIAQKNISNGQSLVYLTHFLNQYANNINYLATAQDWLNKAKPLLKTDKELADWNYETAVMNQKIGDRAIAKKSAQEAKRLAVLGKMGLKDMKRFDDLLNDLK